MNRAKARWNENTEANRLLGIKNIHQSYRPGELLGGSEIQIKRPLLATDLRDGVKRIMDLKYSIFFDCPICVVGKIMGDTRKRLRASQCSNCQNGFWVAKNAGGEFKIKFAPEIDPSPYNADW